MQKIDLRRDSWCVLNDGSQRFNDTVIKWCKDNLGNNYGGEIPKGWHWIYNNNVKQSYVASDPYGEVLTIDEFATLSTEQQQLSVLTAYRGEKDPKGKIKAIHVYDDGFCSAQLEYPDKTLLEIKIPAEALEGLSLVERTQRIMQRAQCHLDQICPVG